MKSTEYNRVPTSVKMEDKVNITISFPKPISAYDFELSEYEDLTCEAVILRCLTHVQEQMKIDSSIFPRETAVGISTYLPAFGLQIISRKKKTYIPLNYKFSPHEHHKDYKFCVRHIPPYPDKESLSNTEIPYYILVWQLFILQGIEDFMCTELNQRDDEADIAENDLMALAIIALFIKSFSDSTNDSKKIDKKFKLENFNFFNYRKHFSKAFIKRLTKSKDACCCCSLNGWFDYIFYYRQFQEWISYLKSQGKFLATYKQEFIYNFLSYHPHYGTERYDVERRKEDHETLEKCSVEIKWSQRGKNQQLGLYINGENACSLTRIQQVIKKHLPNTLWEVLIATESLEQYVCLIFKEEEELDSFLSLLQGRIFLSIQPDLYLSKQLMPQSAVIKDQLRSFGPMIHFKASNLLSNSNVLKPEREQKRFLLYQDKDDLYVFNVATETKDDTRYQVRWTPKDKFTICENGDSLLSYSEVNAMLQQFYEKYNGSQLYPKQFTRRQKVNSDSIYHMEITKCEDNEEVATEEPKDFNNLQKFIQEKDIVPRSKIEIRDENGDLKRFKVTIDREDKLLVEVHSCHPKAQEAILQNILTMTQLAELSPKSFLSFHCQAIVKSMKLSFVFEYPTHGTLNMFLNENKDNLSWLHKLKICLQVIGALNTLQKEEIFHGNIRSSNFYVFIYENREPIVKLGDPGLVYMYDHPQSEFSYLSQRSPWMAPERLKNLQCINKDTECYAVGTTLCEILHCTDDLKSLLELSTDEDVLQFFKQGNRIPPPVLLYSENHPKTVTSDMKKILIKAWEMVKACWNHDPHERPTALDLACEFRELIQSASEFSFEHLMDYLRPVLSGAEGALTPKDISELLEKQSEYYIKPDQLILTDDVLGHGHFGEVVKCRIRKQKSTGDNMEMEECSDMAAKKLFESNNNPSMIKEIDLISSLNHENIVKFLHFTFTNEGPVILIMEYLKEGDLLQFVRSISKKPDKNNRKIQYFMTLLKLSHDVAKGMEYLHSQNIIHCDLAARNVFLYKDTQPTVTKIVAKVGDLGLAKIVKVNQNHYASKRGKTTQLPFCWSAPEYNFAEANNFNNLVLRFEGDVWSYGILLWEVFTLGRTPSKDFPAIEVLYCKMKNGWRLEKKYLQFDDRVHTDIMMKCWEWDYTKRPSFSELNSIIQGLLLSLEKTQSFA